MISTDIINIGILGCANIAKRSVIPAVSQLNGYYNIIGIASRTLKKAEKLADVYNTKAFEGYQNLLDMPEMHAVYIPLPNDLHAFWIEKALQKNLHVLVEKSLAVNYPDVVRLNEMAKDKDLALVENFQFRFHSQLQFIKNIIKEGKIGDIRCFRSSFGFPGLSDPEDIRYQKSLGGGALMDAGAYPVKIAQIFLGNEIEVKAANLNSIPGKEVDIFGGAYLKQKNGDLFGELAFGFSHYYQCNIEIWGSAGKIYTNRIFTAQPGFEPEIELETDQGKEIMKLPADNHFQNMLLHFGDLIHSNNSEKLEDEYLQNINQARLINEIKRIANE